MTQSYQSNCQKSNQPPVLPLSPIIILFPKWMMSQFKESNSRHIVFHGCAVHCLVLSEFLSTTWLAFKNKQREPEMTFCMSHHHKITPDSHLFKDSWLKEFTGELQWKQESLTRCLKPAHLQSLLVSSLIVVVKMKKWKLRSCQVPSKPNTALDYAEQILYCNNCMLFLCLNNVFAHINFKVSFFINTQCLSLTHLKKQDTIRFNFS